jgi:D-glycero-D-manno-heptose 1,7-bisphosphate phosphatase
MMKLPKIVFTDRDGVLNRNTPGEYNIAIKDFILLPGVKEAVARLNRAGYELHLVSNQQGVPKGLMTKENLKEMTQVLIDRLKEKGGHLDSINYCLHLSDEKCACRKPQPGLLKKAVKGREIDFTKTWMVGDSWRDIEAGQALGCRTVLVRLPGYKIKSTNPQTGKVTYTNGKEEFTPDYAVTSFAKAVELILKEDSHAK